MKGVIAMCLKEMIEEKFGKDRWKAVMREAGIPPETMFLATQDIPDDAIFKALGATCCQLKITSVEAADAFGDYWINTYAPKVYPAFFRTNKTAKDLILDMGRIHDIITKSIPNAHPPRFTYEWSNPKTLVIHYSSKRGMVDLAVGLLKGVGHYYRENISVRKLAADRIEVTFP
jgi:hypothetical protein